MDLRLWYSLENKMKSCLILETGKSLSSSTLKKLSHPTINFSTGLKKTKSPTSSCILMGLHSDAKPSILTMKEAFGKSGFVSTTNISTGAAGFSTFFPTKLSIFQVLQSRKERNLFSTLATTGLTRDFSSRHTREKFREGLKICLQFNRLKRVNSLQWVMGHFPRR